MLKATLAPLYKVINCINFHNASISYSIWHAAEIYMRKEKL